MALHRTCLDTDRSMKVSAEFLVTFVVASSHRTKVGVGGVFFPPRYLPPPMRRAQVPLVHIRAAAKVLSSPNLLYEKKMIKKKSR